MAGRVPTARGARKIVAFLAGRKDDSATAPGILGVRPLWITASNSATRTAEIMHSPHEFWMRLYELSRAYDAEAETSQKRLENIVADFEEMPRVAQHEVFAALARVMTSMQELYPEILDVLADAKTRQPQQQQDRSA